MKASNEDFFGSTGQTGGYADYIFLGNSAKRDPIMQNPDGHIEKYTIKFQCYDIISEEHMKYKKSGQYP